MSSLKSVAIIISLIISMTTLTGCTKAYLAAIQQYQRGNPADQYFYPVAHEVDPEAPRVLRVVGYASVPTSKSGKPSTRQRLIAMRASKLDAFRTLAERINGIKIEGSTSVKEMAVENDHLQSFVDASIYGARVVSTEVMDTGEVQTVLEMTIDQGFRNCLQTVNEKRIAVDCRIPSAGRRNVKHSILSSLEESLHSSETDQPAGESQFYRIE